MTSLRHIDQISRRVRDCAWSPFQLHEIVTLEGCLRDCSAADPKYNLLLRKLANESVFVEPSRRLAHLARTKQDELDDAECRRKGVELRDQVDKLNDQLDFYAAFLDDLPASRDRMRAQIRQLDGAFVALEEACKLLAEEFGLLLKRVHVFFDNSFRTIKKLPAFMLAIRRSKLIQQGEILPELYRKYLLKLIRQQPHVDPTTLKHQYAQLASEHLSSYLDAFVRLFRDLALVEKLYYREIPDELEYLRTFEQHISYLERPITKPLRWLTVVSCDNDDSCATFNNDDDEELDESGGASQTGRDRGGAPACELPPALDLQPPTGASPELALLFGQIAKLCKRINGAGGG